MTDKRVAISRNYNDLSNSIYKVMDFFGNIITLEECKLYSNQTEFYLSLLQTRRYNFSRGDSRDCQDIA